MSEYIYKDKDILDTASACLDKYLFETDLPLTRQDASLLYKFNIHEEWQIFCQTCNIFNHIIKNVVLFGPL